MSKPKPGRVDQRKILVAKGRRTIFKTIYKNICTECHQEFTSTRSDALTCGDACRQRRKTRKDAERAYLRALQEIEPLFGGTPEEKTRLDPDGWKAFPWSSTPPA